MNICIDHTSNSPPISKVFLSQLLCSCAIEFALFFAIFTYQIISFKTTSICYRLQCSRLLSAAILTTV